MLDFIFAALPWVLIGLALALAFTFINKSEDKGSSMNYIGVGIGVGTCLGVSLGHFLGNTATGVAVGMLIGLSVGVAKNKQSNK
ncbi:MAG: hypothetical protein Q4B60_07030 [Erysipelotrichaceae bacterium]|nr:hypothetical protein [Erysipelotrichaceae bacterium]